MNKTAMKQYFYIIYHFYIYTEKYHSTAKKSENTVVVLNRTGCIEKIKSLLS